MKVVGDFVDNYKQGLPSEMALLNLFCPRTGIPKAVIDAAGITDMRTGALTAIGAKHLATEKTEATWAYRGAWHCVLETFACSITYLTLKRSVCIRAGLRAVILLRNA